MFGGGAVALVRPPAAVVASGDQPFFGRSRLLAHPLIFVHRFADRREEGAFADLIKQPEAFEFVLHRIFEFGEAQFCAGTPERFIQF